MDIYRNIHRAFLEENEFFLLRDITAHVLGRSFEAFFPAFEALIQNRVQNHDLLVLGLDKDKHAIVVPGRLEKTGSEQKPYWAILTEGKDDVLVKASIVKCWTAREAIRLSLNNLAIGNSRPETPTLNDVCKLMEKGERIPSLAFSREASLLPLCDGQSLRDGEVRAGRYLMDLIPLAMQEIEIAMHSCPQAIQALHARRNEMTGWPMNSPQNIAEEMGNEIMKECHADWTAIASRINAVRHALYEKQAEVVVSYLRDVTQTFLEAPEWLHRDENGYLSFNDGTHGFTVIEGTEGNLNLRLNDPNFSFSILWNSRSDEIEIRTGNEGENHLVSFDRNSRGSMTMTHRADIWESGEDRAFNACMEGIQVIAAGIEQECRTMMKGQPR